MAYRDSDITTAVVALAGVWLHDPADPDTTARQYLFGRAARATSVDVESTALQFAGRVFPVEDFGDQQTQTYTVRVEIPDGPDSAQNLADLQGFATARRTLMLRDNRGRRAHGTLSAYREDDQEWGTQVSFTFSRRDYDEGTEVSI